jgi:hypothetical protein
LAIEGSCYLALSVKFDLMLYFIIIIGLWTCQLSYISGKLWKRQPFYLKIAGPVNKADKLLVG